MLLKACTRGALATIGLSGAIWCIATLPAFWSAVPANEFALRILAGDTYRSAVLSKALVSAENALMAHGLPRSDIRRARALIRLRIAEEAKRNGSNDADNEEGAADNALRSALTLEPASSSLWLMLYSLEIARYGFDETKLGFLDRSYATAPLEAWIALRRNGLALAAFSGLDKAMQSRVVAEFASLVDSDLQEVAARNLAGVGWAQREQLLQSLGNVHLFAREAFARKLSRDGVNVVIPGVEHDERMWR